MLEPSAPPSTPRAAWEQCPESDPRFTTVVEPYAAPVSASATPFTVLSFSELVERSLPPMTHVLGEGIIVLGQLTTVIGQGGTGKSRVVMQIALSQILGRPFAGFTTHPEPLRHLLIGTENSIYRQQSDLRKMTAALTPEERDLLGRHLYFHVVEQVDDAFINLGSEDIRERWRLTLDAFQPDCVYIDPFGEINIGDINKDADVRHTLRELTKICRRHNHNTAIVVVHHGRTGRQNIAQAVGWDKGNFALGSKALYSGARSQLNIAPADPEDSSRIVLSCGKSNDAKPFQPVGLKLHEESMLYEVDASFDLSVWKDDVEGRRSGQSASIKDIITAVQAGNKSHNAICRAVSEATGCSRSTAKRRVQDAIDKGYMRKNADQLYFLTQKSLAL